MNFPIKVTVDIHGSEGPFKRDVILNDGLTVLLGPNGSGKTHILRGLKSGLKPHVAGKLIRFLSAGRIGLLEQYRSILDGHRPIPEYDNATFGTAAEVKQRHQIESLAGSFQSLSARPDILIKVQERLRNLFGRDLFIDWDAGRLKVLFTRLSSQSKPYSSGREASGLLHLVGVLAVLYDDDVGGLLIDEPEVALHPQLQAFLLQEIQSVSGLPGDRDNKKIVVLATHSPEMVPLERASQLPSLVFCYDLDLNPVQLSVEADELKGSKLQGLVARLGHEHKLALFSRRPLLVEGPSDAIICSALSRRAGMYLEAAGSQIIPVIGKGQMPVVAKLMRLLGKSPVALADADGIADNLELVIQFIADSASANQSASSLGFDSAIAMAKSIFNDFSSAVSKRWDEIASIASSHEYWTGKEPGTDEVAKRRAAFCAICANSEAKLRCLALKQAYDGGCFLKLSHSAPTTRCQPHFVVQLSRSDTPRHSQSCFFQIFVELLYFERHYA